MLVLSRRRGESLRLGDDIEVTVLKVTPGGVSLGIRAPKNLPILRGELAAAVLDGNRRAAENAPGGGELEELSQGLARGGGLARAPAPGASGAPPQGAQAGEGPGQPTPLTAPSGRRNPPKRSTSC